MKKITKFAVIVILLMSVLSMLPTAVLYLKPDPAPYTNSEVAAKLKDNKGDYFAFVVLGDCHSGFFFNDSATLKLIRSINREDRFKKIPFDFTVITGDLSFRGSGWEYRIFNKIRSMIKWPVICAIGNHDRDKSGAAFFNKYIKQAEFSFANRNSYFIVIDNAIGSLNEKQFSYLEEELKRSSSYAHRFIIAHKSPISPYQQSWYRPETNPWSYRFMKLCERYKVDVVLAGHEHMFNEKTHGGVRYIVSGGGGMITQFPDRDGGFLHYIVIRVYGDYVDYEVRKIFPPLWEFLTYYMWKDVFYFLKSVVL